MKEFNFFFFCGHKVLEEWQFYLLEFVGKAWEELITDSGSYFSVKKWTHILIGDKHTSSDKGTWREKKRLYKVLKKQQLLFWCLHCDPGCKYVVHCAKTPKNRKQKIRKKLNVYKKNSLGAFFFTECETGVVVPDQKRPQCYTSVSPCLAQYFIHYW